MASAPRGVLRPGSTIHRASGAGGCLGAVVLRGAAAFVRSNAHVLAGPEPVDAGATLYDAERRPLGTLHAHTPLLLDPEHVHRHDLAVFRVSPEVAVDPAIPGLGVPELGIFERPPKGTAVTCLGRGGVLRHGHVVEPECGMWVDVPRGGLRFEGLVAVAGADGAPFSVPGDSGALVVAAASRRALGLLVGGEGDVSVMCPLDLALLALPP